MAACVVRSRSVRGSTLFHSRAQVVELANKAACLHRSTTNLELIVAIPVPCKILNARALRASAGLSVDGTDKTNGRLNRC